MLVDFRDEKPADVFLNETAASRFAISDGINPPFRKSYPNLFILCSHLRTKKEFLKTSCIYFTSVYAYNQ
ncbi:MAG TPA: hypothetical protein DCO86_01590 [Spirochaetaceae bacterium]|nr:hypothetical protein [Spirochaetaceae bacterium]